MKESTGKGTILILSKHRQLVLRECMPRVTTEEYYSMLKQIRENQPSTLQEPASPCLTWRWYNVYTRVKGQYRRYKQMARVRKLRRHMEFVNYRPVTKPDKVIGEMPF